MGKCLMILVTRFIAASIEHLLILHLECVVLFSFHAFWPSVEIHFSRKHLLRYMLFL